MHARLIMLAIAAATAVLQEALRRRSARNVILRFASAAPSATVAYVNDEILAADTRRTTVCGRADGQHFTLRVKVEPNGDRAYELQWGRDRVRDDYRPGRYVYGLHDALLELKSLKAAPG